MTQAAQLLQKVSKLTASAGRKVEKGADWHKTYRELEKASAELNAAIRELRGF